ncbi:MAG: U5 small nuclear ribonucleoprotein 40 kDa protein [Benniella sp.]|nr:MAG: U5 small nuclear ribonucleoprotein 40 kDa protein [Benniella sp.]
MLMDKRKEPPTLDDAPFKRLRPDDPTHFSTTITRTIASTRPWALPLHSATTKVFQGHTAEVYTCQFSPSGHHIASAGVEKRIYLWNTFGDSSNYGIIAGHIGSIQELQWSKDERTIFTASADKTCGAFDAQTGERIRSCKGHTAAVNSCSLSRQGPELLTSGSDDGSAKIWDLRTSSAVVRFGMNYPITSVCFSDTNELLFAAGNNHSILAWDIRANRVRFTLRGHLNTVTGISLSQDGTQLLSYAMDNKVRLWDVTPSVENTHRLRATLEGAVHGSELRLIRPAWSKDGSMLGTGSGDGTVTLWNAYTHQIIYRHSSHKGSANAIDFHHMEPAVLSCSSDQTLVLGKVHSFS